MNDGHSAEKDAGVECNWPRCHGSPNPCFAWCKCRCHTRPLPRTKHACAKFEGLHGKGWSRPCLNCGLHRDDHLSSRRTRIFPPEKSSE